MFEQKCSACLTLIAITVFTLTSWKEVNPVLFEKKKSEFIYCPGLIEEWSTGQKKRCQCQFNSYVKNSKLCNNLTYKGFTAKQKLTFISFSASRCCVNKAAACMLSHCTHSEKASLLCIAFCFCGFCKLVFLFVLWIWSFLFLCHWVRKDSSSEGITWEVKSYSHTVVYPSLLFYVKYALCILTTIKGIETFSTCAIETCFIYPVNGNQFEYFASWRVRASSCTIDTYVCIFVVHG